MDKISDVLKKEIQDKGYETQEGKVKFPKSVRDKFRAETRDYCSNIIIITDKMINVYNEGDQ